MAELTRQGEDLVLRLTRAEKLEGAHGDLQVSFSAVRGMEVLEDAHGAADFVGVKVGSRIPGVVEVGTIRGQGKKVFAAVHRDTPRGIRVRLEGVGWDEWVVGCSDPESTIAALGGTS